MGIYVVDLGEMDIHDLLSDLLTTAEKIMTDQIVELLPSGGIILDVFNMLWKAQSYHEHAIDSIDVRRQAIEIKVENGKLWINDEKRCIVRIQGIHELNLDMPPDIMKGDDWGCVCGIYHPSTELVCHACGKAKGEEGPPSKVIDETLAKQIMDLHKDACPNNICEARDKQPGYVGCDRCKLMAVYENVKPAPRSLCSIMHDNVNFTMEDIVGLYLDKYNWKILEEMLQDYCMGTYEENVDCDTCDNHNKHGMLVSRVRCNECSGFSQWKQKKPLCKRHQEPMDKHGLCGGCYKEGEFDKDEVDAKKLTEEMAQRALQPLKDVWEVRVNVYSHNCPLRRRIPIKLTGGESKFNCKLTDTVCERDKCQRLTKNAEKPIDNIALDKNGVDTLGMYHKGVCRDMEHYMGHGDLKSLKWLQTNLRRMEAMVSEAISKFERDVSTVEKAEGG